MVDERLRHRAYTREIGDDTPDVRDWVWPFCLSDAGMRVLVVNAGSSSLKLRVLDDDDDGRSPRPTSTRRAGRPDQGAPGFLAAATPAQIDAVGHRVVHGGDALPGGGA